MKITNIKQLILNYFSGAKDFIPTKYLKDVKIVGDNEGGSDGGGGGEDSGSIADKAFKMIRTSNADGILYGGQFYPNDDNIKPIIESLYTYRDNHEDFAILYDGAYWGKWDLIGQNKKFFLYYGNDLYLPIICSINSDELQKIYDGWYSDAEGYTGIYPSINYIEINDKGYNYLNISYEKPSYSLTDISFLEDIIIYQQENEDNITVANLLYNGGRHFYSNNDINWLKSVIGEDYNNTANDTKNAFSTYFKLQNTKTFNELKEFINTIITTLGYSNDYEGSVNVDCNLLINNYIRINKVVCNNLDDGLYISLRSDNILIGLAINKTYAPNDLIVAINDTIESGPYGTFDWQYESENE